MTEPSRDDRLDDLQRALALYAEHADSSEGEIDAVLDAHPGLRGLLEPMFRPVVAIAGDEGGGGAGGGDEERVLGDYRLHREIGRGGMGVVYEATEMSLGRRVALKVLAPDRVEDAASIVRFQREAAAAAHLEHPGLVKVLAAGGVGESHFIAMEFVSGAPLNAVVSGVQRLAACPSSSEIARTLVLERAHRPEPDDRTSGSSTTGTSGKPSDEDPEADAHGGRDSYIAWAVDIVAQVAEALDHAHQRGVIHRDVKPANILVRRDNTAVLTDFGVARRADTPALTKTGDAPGTPYYMAPEQVESWRHEVDHRADIFGLGVTLYELLTRQRPFRGATNQQVMDQIVRADPVEPQRLNSQLPADLSAVVLMALDKDPARRYATAADFAADLRAFLGYRTVRARRPTRIQGLIRWARRRPVAAMAAGLLCLAVPGAIAGAGYWAAIQPTLRAGEATLRQNRLETALTAGFLAMKSRDPVTARREFEAVLQLDPQNVEGVAGLVLLKLDFDVTPTRARAQAELARHGDLVDRTRALRRLRGMISRFAGDVAAADAIDQELGEVRGALDAFVAGSTEIVFGHGGRSGAYRRACEHFELAVASAPRPRAIYDFALAHALGHLGADPGLARQIRQCADIIEDRWADSPAAAFWIAYALGDREPARAASWMRKAVEQAPHQAWMWTNLGFHLQKASDPAGAAEAYARSLALRPDDPGTLHDLGIVKQRTGDHRGAIELFERRTELAADDPDAWTDLGITHALAEQPEAAARALEKALALDPRHAQALQHRGRLAAARRDWAAAVRDLRASTAARDDDDVTWFHLGIALARTGERSAAIDAYREALRVNPRNAQAHTNLGNLLAKTDHVAAASHLREALRLIPSMSKPRRTLFSILNDHGSTASLEEHCEAWRRELPDDPWAYSRSAWFTLWCGPDSRAENARAALPWAERAARISGEAPRMLHVLGVVQMHAGDYDAAVATLQRGVKTARERNLSVQGVQNVLRGALATAEKMRESR